MQALKLKPWFGWSWIRAGWRLFRRQPLGFVALLFFYWLLLLSASAVIGWIAHGLGLLLPFLSVDLVAAFGSMLVAMFTPALTVGFLQACRGVENGQPVHPLLLFAPFRAGRQTLKHLLVLGSIQMFALVLIVFMTGGLHAHAPNAPSDTAPQSSVTQEPRSSPSSSDPPSASTDLPPRVPDTSAAKATKPNAPARDNEADQEELRREAVARFVQALAYMPVALLMWYAPMLSAWHGMPAGKALFFSVVAVWRNLGTFIVYGIAWLSIWMTVTFAIGLVASLIGVTSFAAVLALPVFMLLLTWMYCSVYPSYATVFVDEAAISAASTGASATGGAAKPGADEVR